MRPVRDDPPRPEPFALRASGAALEDLRAWTRACPPFTGDPAGLAPEERAWILGGVKKVVPAT
jgi:hypothetical protein